MPTSSLPAHSRSHRARRLGAALVCTALAAGATQGVATSDARAATTTTPVTASALLLDVNSSIIGNIK